MTESARIRDAIIVAIPNELSNFGATPNQRVLYLPRAHAKALQLESTLVVGSRGVGKSFWTAALNSPTLRALLGASLRELENIQVAIGFSVSEDVEAYPNAEVFSDLLSSNFTAYEIWRAVVSRWLSEKVGERIPTTDWRATTEWVKSNPEPLAKIMQRADSMFQTSGVQGLILFDALDRSSNDWRTMDTIVRDLLRVALWLKSYPTIHAKVFLRDDQLARTVTDFPDASKLLATKSELIWQPHDLHGLLWQLLCNAPQDHGIVLRNAYSRVIGKDPENREDSWFLQPEAKQEGTAQRKLFEALAGPWMGRDRRRGVPYVWAVSHLADGKGRISPRSFLAAIRAAAEDSSERYLNHTYALHYESIKRGVQKASEIRIAEMAEDYPWVTNLFNPLRGVTVPCEFAVLEERWNQRFGSEVQNIAPDRLPPQHMERGWYGVMEDIERLGIFDKMKDGRINMPDLYRVGFGLGRRGGVKPTSRG